ncbi:MAG: VPLPA-CTERM-specific exosortase XrtD [Chitinophagaceae bacterium]|nr:VPLPA-CTERM-specific exosortase XrtD [Rubrivivax sp.]
MSTALGAHPSTPVWKSGPMHWLAIGVATIGLLGAFFDALHFMFDTWGAVEEYSYGYFVPVIAAFLIWRKAEVLREHRLQGQWSGLVLIALALFLLAAGHLSAIRLIGQYGFVVAVFGVAVCAIGWRGTRHIAIPLAFLVFMIPLPQFLLLDLSNSLQLVSSQWGVALIRLFDISVHLEGNVIDLGTMKLQVVEACSGLRYLFPLMVLGVLAAYFFHGAWWKRALIVLSTVPLTIGINSLRIGLIGVTVEHWGREMAEGILHDFEGWFMFMICLALLIGEMALLARWGRNGQSLRAVFGVDPPVPVAPGSPISERPASTPAWAAAAALAAACVYMLASPQRDQSPPARQAFSAFPMELPGGWRAQSERIGADVLAILALDDYFMANYSRVDEPPVNFYTAYYASQSGGGSTHSPRTCLPGGGWAMTDLKTVDVALPAAAGATLAPLRVNRVLIQQGDSRQLVYYWFRGRGRQLTDEFEVKWFILSDGITMNRSDCALVRLITPLARNEDVQRADRRLTDFLAQVQPLLPAYAPD